MKPNMRTYPHKTDKIEKRTRNPYWLKPYQWNKGESGNKGQKKITDKEIEEMSMKQWTRNYLKTLNQKERRNFLKHVRPSLAWRMAEGNPDTSTELKVPQTLTELILDATRPTNPDTGPNQPVQGENKE